MKSGIDIIGKSCFLIKDRDLVITDPWFGESIWRGMDTVSNTCDLYTATYFSNAYIYKPCTRRPLLPSLIREIFTYSLEAKIILIDRGKGPCFVTTKLKIFW